MTTTVAPGDRILPNLTAEWYNSTLISPSIKSTIGKRQLIAREGELHCVSTATGTLGRHHPVGISALAAPDDTFSRVPFVSEDAVDGFNWIIPQENLTEGGMVLCVVSGLTLAWVTTTDTKDTCVIYDTTTSKLITAREGKAQILVKGDTTSLSLINIGNQCNCIRVVGKLASALSATCGSITLNTLSGVNFSAESIGTSLSAYNLHTFESDTGQWARAEWVYDNARWELYQVSCPDSPICS